MLEKDMLLQLYRELEDWLNRIAAAKFISHDALQKYFVPEGVQFSQSFFYRLASSLQNSGQMSHSIQFHTSEPHRRAIGNVLYDFNAEKAAMHYAAPREVYDALLSAGIHDNGTGKNQQTNWMKYARGLFDGAHFLATEGGEEKLAEMIAMPETQIELNDAIEAITGIQKRIHGLGFALTCDWLKECGCTWLAKPDIHINKIVSRIKEKDSVPDKEVVRFIFDWAKLVREEGVDEDATTYKLDKMLWLVCTENFYLDFQGNNRDRICQRVETLLNTEG